MNFGTHSIFYLAIAAAIMAFCFWKPQFPRAVAAWIGLRTESAVRRFLLAYWIAVPVVIYRFLYLATAP
jgi:hypothetical protein